MAAKNGASDNESLAMIAVTIGRHVDQRERPILRALETLTNEVRSMRAEINGVCRDMGSVRKAIGNARDRSRSMGGEVRGLRTDLRSLDRMMAANFAQLREDLRSRDIPARKPRFHRSAAE